MPPKTTFVYEYEKVEYKGKSYKMPRNVTVGSRRFHWWIRWQDMGLKLPTYQPKVEILPHGVLPFQPFAQYEQLLKAA